MDYVEKIRQVKTNHYYSLTLMQASALKEASDNMMDAVYLGFLAGYMQGKKAAKAEIKKAQIK